MNATRPWLQDRKSPPQGIRSSVELIYVAAFVAVELLGLIDPLITAFGQAILVLALINHYILAERDHRQPLLLALAVASLYRLLAFTPLPTIDFTNHLVLVGAPMLIATILALRLLQGPGLRAVGEALRPNMPIWQLPVALSGIPLSVVAFMLLKPGFVVTFSGAGRHPAAVAAAVVALAVFSGLGEELLFRVLLHSAARTSFGPAALYVSSAVFGAAYFGTRSIPFVLFVVAVGAFFGWVYERTGSILGSAVAHSLISIGVFVVWPSLGHIPHL
ncbi:MAG: Abortive infection protein [Actinobacteria bacterium]|nr:Abortive infection protein [Actinomycetota bacterium]MCW3044741.1 Abortive infection protein [Actinomycetota bacterium]